MISTVFLTVENYIVYMHCTISLSTKWSTSAVAKKLPLAPRYYRVRSAAMLICIYSVVKKLAFHPAGATHCPDKNEIGHGEQSSRLSRQKYGNTAPKTQKFEFWP